MNTPELNTASFVFTQEGNTLQTTEEYEQLDISLETQLPGDEPFIVIKSRGWSINDMSELTELVEKCLESFK